MSQTEDLRADREKKIAELRANGTNPYPATTHQTHTIKRFTTYFGDLESAGTAVVLVGRVVAKREHGALAFLDISDGTGKVQIFCSKEFLGEELFDSLVHFVSTGDFVELTGTAFVTKREMEALQVTNWRIIGKATQNIPTEHFGIKDEDERLRKRYLDILTNPEARELFDLKANFWKASRRFLEDKGFAEVHTPTLETTTGGAEANPFVTHHDDFDLDVFLRISVGELWQKRLMAAGMPRVFEVGRVYRNEGSSPDHLQEFTNIEFYASYMNFDAGLTLLEEHITYVLDEAFGGKRVFIIKGFEVDFSNQFERIDYVATVLEVTGVNVVTATDKEIEARVIELGIQHEGDNRERLTDTLWKYCRKQIAGPVWLTGHPKLVSPLAKESDQVDGTVLRAQLIMAGAEFNNCFAELNDPQEQRERFETQAQLLAGGDTEAMMPDWEFVEMLEHGMPPTFGAATLGERFFAYLVDRPIRETQYFPLMRPKEVDKKSAEVQIAVAVLNNGADLLLWQRLNTVAHLSAELGVHGGKKLQKFSAVTSKDGVCIPMNIQHAILIKTAPESVQLQTLMTSAQASGLDVSVFTRDMLETTNDKKIKAGIAEKEAASIEYLGVLVFGPKSVVDTLTADFPLVS
jgi:lysyl-tRNA synthetase class 2